MSLRHDGYCWRYLCARGGQPQFLLISHSCQPLGQWGKSTTQKAHGVAIPFGWLAGQPQAKPWTASGAHVNWDQLFPPLNVNRWRKINGSPEKMTACGPTAAFYLFIYIYSLCSPSLWRRHQKHRFALAVSKWLVFLLPKNHGNLWSSWQPPVLQRWLCHSTSGCLHSTEPAQSFELQDWAWHCEQRTLATLSDITLGFLLFSVFSAKAITCPSCKNIYWVYGTKTPTKALCHWTAEASVSEVVTLCHLFCH